MRDNDTGILPKLFVIFHGEVASIQTYGAFIKIPGCKKQGLVHKSQMSTARVDDPAEMLAKGEKVYCKVIAMEEDGSKISLSMKVVNQTTGQDLDPNNVQMSQDEKKRRQWNFKGQNKIELGAELNTTCRRCGGRGHLAMDCFVGKGDNQYDLIPDLDKLTELPPPDEQAQKAKKKKEKKAKKKKKKEKKRRSSSEDVSESDESDHEQRKRRRKDSDENDRSRQRELMGGRDGRNSKDGGDRKVETHQRKGRVNETEERLHQSKNRERDRHESNDDSSDVDSDEERPKQGHSSRSMEGNQRRYNAGGRDRERKREGSSDRSGDRRRSDSSDLKSRDEKKSKNKRSARDGSDSESSDNEGDDRKSMQKRRLDDSEEEEISRRYGRKEDNQEKRNQRDRGSRNEDRRNYRNRDEDSPWKMSNSNERRDRHDHRDRHDRSDNRRDRETAEGHGFKSRRDDDSYRRRDSETSRGGYGKRGGHGGERGEGRGRRGGRNDNFGSRRFTEQSTHDRWDDETYGRDRGRRREEDDPQQHGQKRYSDFRGRWERPPAKKPLKEELFRKRTDNSPDRDRGKERREKRSRSDSSSSSKSSISSTSDT